MPLPILFFLAFAQDAPRLLVAPLAPLKKGGPSPSASLGDQIANQMDEDGRTRPIVWGLTDPTFRTAALEGKLGNVPVLPTREQALDAARRLGATYVLVYRSERSKDGKLEASAELMQDGRTLWKDAKSMGALHGAVQDDADAAGSIARTWVVLLGSGPLKALPSKKAAATPDPTPGQNPTPVDEPPPLPPPVTNLQTLESRLGDLAKAGKPDAARALARDAVDADPLSPGPRTVLVRLLAAQGDAAAAAQEARRAADLMPERPELRTDAVRRLLGVGQTREAKAALQGLPDEPPVRRLGAEVALAEDDAPGAIREVEPLLKTGEDLDARLLRGLARARLGGAEGAAADLKAWSTGTTDPIAHAEGYALARRTLGAMASKAADAVLPLLQRAGAQPKSGAVRDELDEAQRQAQARAAAWSALAPPAGVQAAYDAWSLAHRLMALVAADLRSFLAGGGEDALTSARIDLGEARRAMREAESVRR